MAGLLDPTDAALMALGTGLLGGGNFSQAFGRGGQAALSTYAAMAQAQQEKALKERELAMQEELKKAQIANYLSEAKAREQQQALAQQKQAQIQGLLSEFNTPQAPINAASAALAGGGGPTMANAANLPQPNPADRMSMIQRMAVAGVPGVSTLFDVEKWKADPLKMEPGATYENRTTKQRETIPRLPEGGQMIGGQFSFVPNYQDSIVGLEGEKTRASEAGKAGYQLVTVANPDGSARQVTLADRVAELSGGTPSQNIGGAITPGLRSLLEADAKREGVASPKINLTNPGSGNTWDLSGAPRQPGMQVQSEADKKFAEGRAASGVKGLDDMRTKAQSAAAALPTIWRAQDLLKNGVLTGLGSDAKLNIARAVSAMGIPVPETIANSQSFDADIAQLVGTNLKTIMGSTQLSNADLEFVSKMFGTRGLEGKALNYILSKFDEANSKYIQQHQEAERSAPGGPAYSPMVQMPERKQSTQAPVRITGDADYNALPSGASFIGPDGRTRRKP